MSAVAARFVPAAAVGSRVLSARVAVPALFVLAAAYHAVHSFWHLTPAIFTDELLYSKLAQSVAAGDGFSIRGEPVFFPALLPVLLQAPAWLVHDAGTAYAIAKTVNAIVMASAVFPAYWLARQLVSPRRAIAAAALTAASPALLYHGYLMSEALAFPVFLLAVATMVRAVARPSRRWEAAVLAVSLVAVLTRVQFIVLPVAYVVAAVVAGGGVRAALRSHRLSIGALGGAGVVALASGGVVLGPYVGAAVLDYEAGALLKWGGLTALLLPFGVAWFLLPGAALGLAALLARPRSAAGSAFAALAVTTGALTLVEITLVAGGQAERPLERYGIYLAPLAIIAFLAYAERGAPWKRAYAAIAVVAGLVVWLVPFPTLAPGLKGYSFSFDSPTLSAYGSVAVWVGHPNAATIFSGGAFLGCAIAAALALRGRSPEPLLALAGSVLLLMGVAAYSGDRAMTSGTRDTWVASQPDWLDRSGLGRVDYLALPGASPHFGYELEAWNRNFGRPLLFGVADADPWPDHRVSVAHDGRLKLDGRAAGARVVAVNDFGSALELDGEVVSRPSRGLTVYRLGPSPHARSLAVGLFADRWARSDVRYQVWPVDAGAGTYRVRLALPEGLKARTATVTVDGGARREVALEPGQSVLVELPAHGRPVPVLRIETDRLDYVGAYTPNPRLVGVRIPLLEWVSGNESAF